MNNINKTKKTSKNGFAYNSSEKEFMNKKQIAKRIESKSKTDNSIKKMGPFFIFMVFENEYVILNNKKPNDKTRKRIPKIKFLFKENK